MLTTTITTITTTKISSSRSSCATGAFKNYVDQRGWVGASPNVNCSNKPYLIKAGAAEANKSKLGPHFTNDKKKR